MRNIAYFWIRTLLAVISASLTGCSGLQASSSGSLLFPNEEEHISSTTETIQSSNMKLLPRTEAALVLRTDFSDQAAWEVIRAEIRRPVDFFIAHLEFVDDEAYRELTKEQLLRLVPGNYEHSFMILVDRTAVSSPEHPLLIVDLLHEPGREFRAVPSQIQGIENNLSIANMFFEEFADNVDEDGVFRGFSEP
jgi:hypothetical protein